MKRKIILAISVLVVLGLSIAAFAYTRTNVSQNTAMSCCSHGGDSCPMKSKDTAAGEKAESCDDCDCCKGEAESCPMKMKGEDGDAMAMHANHQAMAGEGKNCCDCCKKDKEKKDAPAA